MKTLIQNGTVVTHEWSKPFDVLIDGEIIADIGEKLSTEGVDRVVDATERLVMPGGIDVHTHLALPMFDTISSDDHYTGHKAAAFGGTTTVMDFIPHEDHDLMPNIERWHAKAEGLAAVDYSFHMNITQFDQDVLNQLPRLLEEGIPSAKMFTAYNHRMRLTDGEIFQVMRQCSRLGILPMLHAENGDVIEVLVDEAIASGHVDPVWHARTRPSWGAVEAVLRGIALAAQAGAPLYVVHMNTAGGADQLRYAKEKGLRVFGETCPPYLFFTEEDYLKPDGAKWICSPPMRSKEDQVGLWKSLEDGIMDTVGTDHCPFFFNGAEPIEYEGKMIAIPGKELGKDDFRKIPNGLPGVGDRMPVIWTTAVNTGRITQERFVSLMSTNPAKLFGMYPQKGTIATGSDADIVVWDPEKEVKYGVNVAQHRTDYNLFEGWQLKGMPTTVFSRGDLLVENGIWYGKAGRGKFLHRKPFSIE
ncbi:MAG: dihydropyrimidinase [Anaerolineae bacterium]|jgi:dihydropyrimidinase|nr:dihydropyrimidinase [Anaerolineae bacterium]